MTPERYDDGAVETPVVWVGRTVSAWAPKRGVLGVNNGPGRTDPGVERHGGEHTPDPLCRSGRALPVSLSISTNTTCEKLGETRERTHPDSVRPRGGYRGRRYPNRQTLGSPGAGGQWAHTTIDSIWGPAADTHYSHSKCVPHGRHS